MANENELKYVHVCSEGKTLGKILQSLTDMRGDIGEHKGSIETLSRNVNELNKQINNGIAGAVKRLDKKVVAIERGERPTGDDGEPAERRVDYKPPKLIDRLTKKEKIIMGVAIFPLMIKYGLWVLNGIGIAVDWLIKVWPK